MKREYQAPKIIDEYTLELESAILAGSKDVIDSDISSVETVGQEVVEVHADQWLNNWE